MVVGWAEVAAREFEPEQERQFETLGELASALEPATTQTQALDMVDEVVDWAYETPDARAIISMPPQEGKSSRVTVMGPIRFLQRNPNMRIAVASYATDLANDFGRRIRNHITTNSGLDETLDLGLRIARDNGAVSDWKLAPPHRGGVRSIGLAAGLTGRPAEALFIDDPIKDMIQAESKAYRERAWSFWQSVAGTRLAPGAPVIVILTRWHHDDLAGRLLSAEDGHRWRVLNIPAQAEHVPEKGETDPLGREPGEYMESARRNPNGAPRSVEQWEAIKVQVGPRVWSALYQGRPTVERGGLFITDWPEYELPMWVERRDGARIIPGIGTQPDVEIVQSWDMTFKDFDSSDYVVGQVWYRNGVNAYLLDQVRGIMSFTETIDALLSLSALWPQAVAKFIEDKANGPAIMNALKRRVAGMIPIEPEGSKYARAVAVSPLTHSGNVILPTPELAPWIGKFKEEMREFPNGAHDDQVDGFSQAVNRILLMPLTEGGIQDMDDILGEETTVSISPY